VGSLFDLSGPCGLHRCWIFQVGAVETCQELCRNVGTVLRRKGERFVEQRLGFSDHGIFVVEVVAGPPGESFGSYTARSESVKSVVD
jgi:hypothetical protein